MPSEYAFDIIELRVGERLSLPNSGDLAQLIQQSSSPLVAMVLLGDDSGKGGIRKSEFELRAPGDDTVFGKPNQSNSFHKHKPDSLRKIVMAQKSSVAKPKLISNQRSQFLAVKPSEEVQNRLVAHM